MGNCLKVLGLNASARKEGNTSSLLNHALEILRRKGMKGELLHLANFKISPCSNCECECLYEKPCPINDEYTKVVKQISNSNGMIIGSPVYGGDIPAILKAFFERGNSLSEKHISKMWKNKPIAIFVIGSLGNTHALQGIFSGLSSGYEGIDPLIVGTAIVPTRNYKYPDAWRKGGLINDPSNQQLIRKLAGRLFSIMHESC